MSSPINFSEGQIQGRHYAMTHNWAVSLTADSDWPSELSDALDSLNDSAYNNGVGIISALCQQVSVPNTNVSTVEGNVRGVHFHQIQTRASAPIQTSMVFYEPHDYRLFRFFELWKSLTVSRWDGSQNPECRIHSGAVISLLTHDRNKSVIDYPLYETFCASAAISDPQGSGSLQQVSVTLQSANYGIIVYNADGIPAYQQIKDKDGNSDADYLGNSKTWMSGDGKKRTV